MLSVFDHHYFHLSNGRVSYIMYLLPNHQLGHLYFGPAISVDADQLKELTALRSKSGGAVHPIPEDHLFTLADQRQELPVYGTTDFRQGALTVTKDHEPQYLNFIYQDYALTHEKPRDLATPASFTDGAVDVLTLHLTDATHHLKLALHYALFADSAAIVRWQTLENTGNSPQRIERIASAVLDLPTADYQFVNLAGAWLRERQITKRDLAQGIVSVESQRGASSHQQNPYTALLAKNGDLRHGDAYGFNLIYSGNFQTTVEVNEWDQTRVTTGLHPDQFAWKLDPETSFTTPEAVMTFSDAGLNGLAQVNAQFAQVHVIAPFWQKRVRPVVLNSWEAAYYDFDTEKLLRLAKAGKQVGIDCFVLDDGWFGHRDAANSSLGDWHAYTKKFPHGIDGFAKSIHDLGLQFGLWFEPEMVSPGSALEAEHPDWVVGPVGQRHSLGRGQYVLDFADPQVVDNLYHQMQKVIDATSLDYIKWDMNRNITEAWSQYLAAHQRPQGEFFHRYIQGVYALYTKLLTHNPHLLIEGCAGGGGRYDLGMLFYSPQIWVSDDSDAIERLKIQAGTALAYPLSTLSNHVTMVPNDQVARNTPLETRYNVARFGALGYELDLTKLSADQLATIRQQITTYKAQQQLVLTGRLELLQTLADGDHNTVAWAVVSSDQKQILFGFYRVLADADGKAVEYLKLPFAQTDAMYAISGRKQSMSGSVLQHIGLRLPYQLTGPNVDVAELVGDYQSAVLMLSAQ